MRLPPFVALAAFVATGVAAAEPGALLFMGLGDLPGGSFYSEPWAVSADGSTVVGESNGASGDEAFIWTSEGGLVGLGALPGGHLPSEAWDVSADGSTVVGWSRNASSDYEAFIWTSEGGMVGLGDLSGGNFNSRARAISADASTAVGKGSSAPGYEAFRWTSGGGMVGLGIYGEAWGVSADGSTLVGLAEGEAFIWDSKDGMRELSAVLTQLGVDLTGWELDGARDVSDDGRVIVGYGTNPSGDTEAWIAVLPIPVPGFQPPGLVGLGSLLLGFGLIGLAAGKRRR